MNLQTKECFPPALLMSCQKKISSIFHLKLMLAVFKNAYITNIIDNLVIIPGQSEIPEVDFDLGNIINKERESKK